MIKDIFFILVILFQFQAAFAELDSQQEKLYFTYCKYVGTDENFGISGLKKEFLEHLCDCFHPDAFIESGTYLGDTSNTAALVFPEVYTIELSSSLYEKACSRFKDQTNVHLYLGDSAKILPNLLAQLKDKKIIFFLDGHFSKRMTAKGETNTPILQELKSIKDNGLKNSIIIVDDIRLFQKPFHQVENSAIVGYPSIQEIFNILLDINPDYCCKIIGDTAIAFPSEENVAVSEVVEACTQSRLFYEQNLSMDGILLVEQVIANAEGEELDCIEKLYEFFGKSELNHGLRSFSSLWYGLTLLKNQETNHALQIFSDASLNSFPDWQINAYVKSPITNE